ncbi:MAG TPA: ribonuclease E/G, partial [Steroidobacteraceae bacterium]|nr:ribonuclease E/G [Steroidobacteraceae bacterium]
GSIVIDPTEALVSIDINSARATRGSDIETTALNTNLEAADEIARQLRLRDLGGLIVIDFIDMESQKNQRAVEDRLRDAVRQDRARIQIGRLSRFGLLELSRQRLRPSIGESTSIACPRCSGMGTIRSVDSLALALLRLIGEEARKDRTVKVIAQLPVEVATYLMNEKREWLNGIETKSGAQVVLVPNKYMETPSYEIRRVRDDEAGLPENTAISHQIPVVPVPAPNEGVKNEERPAPPAPVVVASSIATIPPPPTIAMETTIAAPPKPPAPVEQIGIFVKMWRFFFGGAGTAAPQPAAPAPAPRESGRPSHDGRRDRHEGRHGRDRDRDRHGRHNRDRDRDRNRHDHKDKSAAGGDARRDGQRHERKPREHSEAGRHEGGQRGGGHSQHRQQNHQQQQQQQQQQSQQPVPPKPEASTQPPGQPAEGSGRPEQRNDRGDRGDNADRGERRGRRGRRRRGGRGRGHEGGATEGGAPSAEPRAEGSGENAREFQPRPEPQHSLDLAAPRAEHAAESAPPPKPERSEPAGDSGHAESKTHTVWSSSPTQSGSSWGGGGSSRREE